MQKSQKNIISPLPVYLAEIQYSILDIESIMKDTTKEVFLSNVIFSRSTTQAFSQIGEAAYKILKNYPEFTEKHPKFPWNDLYNQRNKFSHHYNDFSPQKMWNNIEKHFNELKNNFNILLDTDSEIKALVEVGVGIYYEKYTLNALHKSLEFLPKQEYDISTINLQEVKKIFLDVPRIEEETKELNKLGAKWDNDTKSLYIMSDNPHKDAVLNQVEAMKQAKLQEELAEASTAKNKQEQGVTLESKQTSSAQTDRQSTVKPK